MGKYPCPWEAQPLIDTGKRTCPCHPAAAAVSDVVKDDDGKRTPAYAIAGTSACITTFFIILLALKMM